MFVALLMHSTGGHPWGLLGFGHFFTIEGQKQVPERFISEFGYDGQFYFVLALSPFLREPAPLGFRIDNQTFRQQRILYPLIVHILAQGESNRTAWFMIILNVLAVGALVALAARLLGSMGQPMGLSLLIGFYPGLAVSVSRGLTEPLCLLWIISAILIWRRWPSLAGGMLGLAVLTRETALLVAAGFGCAWLIGIIKKEVVPPARIWIFPLVVYLLWHGFLLFWVVHGSIGQAASEKIGWPLTGLIQALWKNASTLTPDHIFYLFFIFTTFVWQFFVATAARRRNDPLYFGWILYGVLLSVVGRDIWDNSPGLLRIATEWNVLGFLLVAASGHVRWKTIAAAWSSCWFLSAVGEWYHYYRLINFW